MGRITPLDGDTEIHPALQLSLAVAATAATIAIFTGLCGLWGKPSPDLTSEDADNESSSESDAPPQQEPIAIATATSTESSVVETGDEHKDILPPPPCMEQGATTKPSDKLMKKSASSRKASSVMSVKKHLRSASVRDVIEKNRPHLHNKSEDTLWKKKIILGDKCRVSHDIYKDDEDDDGDNSLKSEDAIADNIDKEKETTRKEEEDS